MNKKIYIASAIALGGLVVGASVEHLRMKTGVQVSVTEDPEVIHHVQKVARQSTSSIDEEKLIAELKAQVVSLTSELEKARAGKLKPEDEAKGDEPEKRDRRGRDGFRERLEKMKTEDPEGYAEMQKRREEFKKRMEERKENKREFLASVSVENMSDDQKVNHERLISLNERVEEIMDLMHSDEVENRDDLRKEMFESMHELHELNELERVYLLEQTANAAGYDGDDAALFTEHIESIIENTSMMGGPGRHGGPPPGGGGGH